MSCPYCEDAVQTIVVTERGENLFPLSAILKPSNLRFEYEPKDATVRVGSVTRSVAESQEHPFVIRSARGPARFEHRVDYEVSAPGFRTEQRTIHLVPGETRTLSGELEPE